MTDRAAPRVFLGLIEVAGFYSQLESALRRAGVAATFVDLSFHRFGYQASSQTWWLIRLMRVVSRPVSGWATLPSRVIFWLGKLALFAWAVVTCNVFVFSYGTSFFWLRDLALLRVLGKRVIFVFHGGDCRPPYLDGFDVRTNSIDHLAVLAASRKERVRHIERYADVIVAPLTCAQFFERPVVSFIALGIPIAAPEDTPAPNVRSTAVRLLHAPSDPAVKGTPLIRAAVEELTRRGYAIEYEEITGRPHADVVRALVACDVVIDQAYSDTPMPGLASEAARAGKPTVIGGYAWHETARLARPEDIPPTVRCEAQGLTEAIERLVASAEEREASGRAVRQFVRVRWSADAVVERFLRLAEGRPDPSWVVGPRELRYVYGAGMPRDLVANTIAAVVGRHGPSALQLDDKPELRAEALALAAESGVDPVSASLAVAVNS